MRWRSGRPWPVAETIEKIMSIRLDEFEAGLLRLAQSYPIERKDSACRFRLGDGTHAVIAIAALPDAVLGGLMRLPRAQVSIRFDGTTAEAAAEFVRLFDRTFQRGGG